uniref:WAT1-related protein n=1 Tax=Manihot esculenta TaxID=3983 RepID=A0A2C9UNF9_MANES
MGSFDECKPVMAMIGIQFVYAGLALLSRAAFLQGLNPWVFVVYRQGIGTLIMAPLVCLSSRRNSCWSSFGFRSFAWIFLASLIGVTANQISYFEGLYLTSSTVGTAMSNLIPAITFVLAIISGLEKVNTFSLRSMAKILGTVVCVSGAISMAFLKGPKLLNTKSPPLKSFSNHGGDYWLLGCLLLFGSSSFWSLWMLFQIPISASCPDHLASSALMGLLATIESAIVTFFLGKDLAAWHLNSFLEIGCCLFGPGAFLKEVPSSLQCSTLCAQL